MRRTAILLVGLLLMTAQGVYGQTPLPTPTDEALLPAPTDEAASPPLPEVTDAPPATTAAADAPSRSPSDESNISYGRAVRGTLTAEGDPVLYRFRGRAGDVVTLTVVADDPSQLDPTLALYRGEGSPTGEPLAFNDDVDPALSATLGYFNTQIAATLPENDTYVVVVGRFIGAGEFTLTLGSLEAPITPVVTLIPTPTLVPAGFQRANPNSGDAEAAVSAAPLISFPTVAPLSAGGAAAAAILASPTLNPASDTISSVNVPPVPPLMSGVRPIRQWASRATGTSEYSDPDWGFIQAVGQPDAPNVCADSTSSWASLEGQGYEILKLTYDTPVIPAQVNIYQNYNPGAIIRVDVTNSATGTRFTLDNGADPLGNTPCPGVFSVSASGITVPVDSVTLHLDEGLINDWNEIDAIELVGYPPEAQADIAQAPVMIGAQPTAAPALPAAATLTPIPATLPPPTATPITALSLSRIYAASGLQVSYPDRWAVSDSAGRLFIGSDQSVVDTLIARGGYLLAPVPQDTIGITIFPPAALQVIGVDTSSNNPEQILSAFNPIFGASGQVVPDNGLAYPAAEVGYTSGAVPVGSVGIAVVYPDGAAVYVVQVGEGSYAFYEPTVTNILNTAFVLP